MRRERAPPSMYCNRGSSGFRRKTDYARSRYAYMIDVIKLQQAAGILSEQSMQRINALLTDAPPPPPQTDVPPAAKVR